MKITPKSKSANKRKLTRIIQKARAELSDIEQTERLIKNRRLIGRFYKYRNSYSCPMKESDYWYVYTAVQRVDAEGGIRQFSFQTDSMGTVEIRPDHWNINLLGGFEEIEQSEFDKAWQKVARFVNRVDFRP